MSLFDVFFAFGSFGFVLNLASFAICVLLRRQYWTMVERFFGHARNIERKRCFVSKVAFEPETCLAGAKL